MRDLAIKTVVTVVVFFIGCSIVALVGWGLTELAEIFR
jgi:hypothetical protein